MAARSLLTRPTRTSSPASSLLTSSESTSATESRLPLGIH
jgi:hypothetical protein